MNVGWGGWRGKIALAVSAYAAACGLLWVMPINTGAFFGLAVPVGFGFYFFARPPVSMVTLAALAVTLLTVWISVSQFE